jgi:hypothetical protein
MKNAFFDSMAQGFRESFQLAGSLLMAPLRVLWAFVNHADLTVVKPSQGRDRAQSCRH